MLSELYKQVGLLMMGTGNHIKTVCGIYVVTLYWAKSAEYYTESIFF